MTNNVQYTATIKYALTHVDILMYIYYIENKPTFKHICMNVQIYTHTHIDIVYFHITNL